MRRRIASGKLLELSRAWIVLLISDSGHGCTEMSPCNWNTFLYIYNSSASAFILRNGFRVSCSTPPPSSEALHDHGKPSSLSFLRKWTLLSRVMWKEKYSSHPLLCHELESRQGWLPPPSGLKAPTCSGGSASPAPTPCYFLSREINTFSGLLWAPISTEPSIPELQQIDSCQSPLFLQPFHFIFRLLSPFFPFCPWFSRQPIWAEPYLVTSCQNSSDLSSVVWFKPKKKNWLGKLDGGDCS